MNFRKMTILGFMLMFSKKNFTDVKDNFIVFKVDLGKNSEINSFFENGTVREKSNGITISIHDYMYESMFIRRNFRKIMQYHTI